MNLTDADIEQYRALWMAEFGEELSAAKARQSATALLELYLILVREDRDGPSEPTPGHTNHLTASRCDISSIAENQAKTKSGRSSP